MSGQTGVRREGEDARGGVEDLVKVEAGRKVLLGCPLKNGISESERNDSEERKAVR
mgnify:CR=1 FL=1